MKRLARDGGKMMRQRVGAPRRGGLAVTGLILTGLTLAEIMYHAWKKTQPPGGAPLPRLPGVKYAWQTAAPTKKNLPKQLKSAYNLRRRPALATTRKAKMLSPHSRPSPNSSNSGQRRQKEEERVSLNRTALASQSRNRR